MTWNPRANELFLAARELRSSAERADFLDRECANDAALRAEVEALLEAGDRAGDFLQSPALTVTIDQPPLAERPGAAVGAYKLLEQIGEGGFGVVFMAEQTQPVRRKVALKVLKPGMDTRQVVARFEAERQALALMDHPNIARVFDGGATDSGRPYFVMELVKGLPITEFCDRNHLTPRQRLELFLPVCAAVQHAHQKGIIHRDLKPANVLVAVHDTVPVVKVIDFGVAKALGQELTDKTLFTGFAQMIGTPLYMSPEQAGQSGLDVDTRTDIYALGVLLYELLTGTTPFTRERFREAAFDEIRRIIREEEPPRPSTRLSELARSGELTRPGAEGSTSSLASVSASRHTEPVKLTKLLRGELDWIVMKTLEKDRNRRYETATALGTDVQHYLHDEPVRACPPSAGYRLRKYLRRHKGPVLAAALVVLALAGGLVGTTWGMLRATGAQKAAVNEANEKEEALRDKGAALAAAQRSGRLADEKLFESYTAQARAFRTSRRPGQRFESLEVLQRASDLARRLDLPAAKFHELSNAVIASLALPDLCPTGPWNPWPADGYAFDFDEAHALYARTDRRGNCSVRRVVDDAELYSLPGLGAPAVPHLSRDGKFLAVQHNRKDRPDWHGEGVQLWALDGATARLIHSEERGFSVDFHPNGRQVGLTDTDGTIRLLELPGGRPIGIPLAPDTLTLASIALHPTEPLVAVRSYDAHVVQIRDVRTGQVVASLPQTAGVTHIAWRPDGRTLAIGTAEPPVIRLYDRVTLQPYRTLEGGGVDFTFNRAGDRLAGMDWGSSALDVFDVDTGQKLFAYPLGRVAHPFRRDGRRLGGVIQDGRLGTCQVGDCREYRTLVRKDFSAKVAYQSVALHPDGRLLAVGTSDGLGLWDVGTSDGLGLWDLASGSELAFLPIDEGRNGVTNLRFEPSGALLTSGFSGLLRWPVRADPQAPDRLLVGPPDRLLPRASHVGQSQDPDGRVIAACNRAVGQWQAFAGGWVLHVDRPGEPPIRLDAGADIIWIAVSPDGRWVVTATHYHGRAKVWDARDARLVKQLADFGAGYPQFSPDGKWLSTDADGGRVFAVGSWEPGSQVRNVVAFAPDSRLMAVQPHVGAIDLVDRVTGRELARLEDPDSCFTIFPFFTSNGTRLIGLNRSGELSKGIGVWDLRLLREHLKKMGLDWDYPEFPPSAEESEPTAALRADILPGDLRVPALTREQEVRQGIDQYRRRVEANPDDAEAANSLAWLYLTGPEALRDAKAALPLAEKAVGLKPGDAMYRNTLGLANYRTGRYREAVEGLRPNLAKQAEWCLAFDLYFLAMSYHRLGETARARDFYDWAVRWPRIDPRLKPAYLEELDMFRAEAAELLGIEAKRD